MMKKLLLSVLFTLLGIGCYADEPIQYPFTVQGDHGKLAGIVSVPANKKTYPLVMILHGFNGSRKLPIFPELSKQLNARGIATVLFDFNGQGESEGSFLDMTIPNELEDARRVYEYVSQLPGVTSVSATGHSQGGVITAMLAGELGKDKLKSIALLAPAAELKDDTAKGDLFGTQFDPTHIPEYIVLFNGLKVGRAFLATTPHLPIYETAAPYTGPVLIVHSVKDELVPYEYGVRFHQLYQNSQLETLYEFDHSFTQDVPAVCKIVTDFFAEQLL